MAKMRTFAGGERKAQRGYTLAELLIVAGVIAAVTAAAAGAMRAHSAARLADRAADTLLLDLKRLRLHAELAGAPVALEGRTDGYGATALDLQRRFPVGVEAHWNGEEEASILVGASARAKGADVVLTGAGRAATVRIAPLTGEIRRER